MKLYCDGASRGNPGNSSIGVCGVSGGKEIFTISQKIGIATNNQAEWNSLKEGLLLAINKGFKEIHVYMDSELVVKQIKGEYKVKNPELKEIKKIVDLLIPEFTEFKIEHIPRNKNLRADELANLALDT